MGLAIPLHVYLKQPDISAGAAYKYGPLALEKQPMRVMAAVAACN